MSHAVDYPPAIPMFVPDSYTFNSVVQSSIVLHCTGGDQTIQSIYNTFYATMRSSHFGIGYGGEVAQYVPLNRGAGANCCADSTHDAYWNYYISRYDNLNLCTLSIEHCNDSTQSRDMTPLQLQASKDLNLFLCQKYDIPSSNIMYHSSIDATNCPGALFLENSLPAIRKYVDAGIIAGGSKMFTDALCVAVWNSFFTAQAIDIPIRDTGIFNNWRAHWRNGDFKGCPLTGEYPVTVPSGGAGVAQDYAGGTCVWENSTGKATWL